MRQLSHERDDLPIEVVTIYHPVIKRVWVGLLLVLASGSLTMALAQTNSVGSAPDKSAYTVFDPTPDDQLRLFCTDRPSRSILPCTVDAGHFQYEADIFNWAHGSSGGVSSDTFFYANPTLKLGLTNRVDVEINIAPAERVTMNGPFHRSDLTGVGDLFLRSRLNLAGPEGADFQAAVLPYVKLPSAKPGIGDKAVEGGVIAPVSFALPQDWTLLFDPEIDILRNTANAGRHANLANLINFSHALSSRLTGWVELWGAYNNDPSGTVKQASFDLAVSWIVWDKLPNLQLDIGTNIGLTTATPRVQAYGGISQRF